MKRFIVIQYRPYSDATPFISGQYDSVKEAIEESMKYTESRGGYKWLGIVYRIEENGTLYPLWKDPKLTNEDKIH